MTKNTEFKALTMKEVLGYCYVAMENLLKNCPHDDIKTKATNLHYDIFLNHRLSRVAGTAWRRGAKRGNKAGGPKGLLKNHSMDLNFVLLSHVNEAERFQTISHELAHLLDYEIRGKSDHKAFWKWLHNWMGGNSERCYQGVDRSAIPLPNKKWHIKHDASGKECFLTNREFRSWNNKYSLSGFTVRKLNKTP